MDTQPNLKKVSILGTVGIPASYGGFETLAENLACYAQKEKLDYSINVYCSGRSDNHLSTYLGANLKYIPIKANGVLSVFYDVASIIHSVRNKDDVILLLGVSGALAIPFVKLFSQSKIITHIDGIEWRRDKWNRLAKIFLRFSEKLAVKYSDLVIADNEAIRIYLDNIYGSETPISTIAYGGDHAKDCEEEVYIGLVPDKYVLALCRIEPENNIDMILEGFSNSEHNLLFIGNWNNSEYGRDVRQRYSDCLNIFLIDPIYSLGVLKTIRKGAIAYVHGHSAGGTNPSLVEMMHFGIPIFAFDCDFNRYTTHNKGTYFKTSGDLFETLAKFDWGSGSEIGNNMLEISQTLYTWDHVGNEYFDAISSVMASKPSD